MADEPPFEEVKQQAEEVRKAAEGVDWGGVAEVAGEFIAEGGLEVGAEVVGGAMEALGSGAELAGGCAEGCAGGCSVAVAFVAVLATAGVAMAKGWF